MKVGTDGVLLGAWAELEEAASILDIGTGTGLIALMAAQRNAQARIDALEIEPAACQEAAHNIRISPWAERIRLYPQALQAFFPAIGYDCILCNPPFFVHSTPAPDNGRSLARHTGTLPHTDKHNFLIKFCIGSEHRRNQSTTLFIKFAVCCASLKEIGKSAGFLICSGW